MYLLGHDNVVNDWLARQGAGRANPGSFHAFGWIHDNVLVGGLLFHTSNGRNCFVNIAVTRPESLRPLLRLGLRYCFGQLALHRLTLFIAADNIRSIRLAMGLGATHEATLREAGEKGEDMHIYALFRESCPHWRKEWQKAATHLRPQTTQS